MSFLSVPEIGSEQMVHLNRGGWFIVLLTEFTDIAVRSLILSIIYLISYSRPSFITLYHPRLINLPMRFLLFRI